jgi:hypothetical protein
MGATTAMADSPIHINTENGAKNSVWFTIYVYKVTGTEIIGSGCVRAGERKNWKGNRFTNGHSYKVRAEMTKTVDCKAMAGNSHVLCDTDTKFELGQKTAQLVQLKTNTKGCYLERP